MSSDLQEKNWLSRKNEFVLNKLSIIKFLNFASSRLNSTCCNKKPVKEEFVILPGLSSKGVACAVSKINEQRTKTNKQQEKTFSKFSDEPLHTVLRF